MRRHLLLILLCFWIAPAACRAQATATPPQAKPAAPADDQAVAEQAEESKPEYVRIRRNERRLAMALETSVIRFGDSPLFPGSTVDLLGAIHLGEANYYEELNRRCATYDALLFEAVMPEEAVRSGFRPGRVRGAGRQLSDEEEWTDAKVGLQAISVLQLGMKDALGLEFQLAGINYHQPNFVHADMTQEQFTQTMARRGESFSKMLAREMGKAMAKGNQRNPIAQQLDLMFSLASSDRVYRVRRIAAAELAKANEGDAFAGEDGTSTIITERNIVALDVLKRQLRQGKKRIGIFYGAGHFPDMEARMLKDFQLKRISEDWITAWKLRPEKKKETKKD